MDKHNKEDEVTLETQITGNEDMLSNAQAKLGSTTEKEYTVMMDPERPFCWLHFHGCNFHELKCSVHGWQSPCVQGSTYMDVSIHERKCSMHGRYSPCGNDMAGNRHEHLHGR